MQLQPPPKNSVDDKEYLSLMILKQVLTLSELKILQNNNNKEQSN